MIIFSLRIICEFKIYKNVFKRLYFVFPTNYIILVKLFNQFVSCILADYPYVMFEFESRKKILKNNDNMGSIILINLLIVIILIFVKVFSLNIDNIVSISSSV